MGVLWLRAEGAIEGPSREREGSKIHPRRNPLGSHLYSFQCRAPRIEGNERWRLGAIRATPALPPPAPRLWRIAARFGQRLGEHRARSLAAGSGGREGAERPRLLVPLGGVGSLDRLPDLGAVEAGEPVQR